ncbi:hypothetical protein LTR09_008695 [Extremus antarcticus]|uniref:Uncharacterized protein n=1 Tax=Extremus antarcticus TaxID=702011 RepID=A0AAJ0DA40_9PEZI|nr:hypothetical protein LTR09_008695 [Extremus antarcticus]
MVALLAAMAVDGCSTPGAKHYQIMNKVDNTKTASAWEHTFRPIKKAAKELAEKITNGDFRDFTTATPTKGSTAGEGKKTPAKRTRKAKGETQGESPTKKVKKEEDGEDGEADAEGEAVSE